MAAAAILDFENCKLLTVGTVKSAELHYYEKIVEIAQTAVEISQFLNV